MKNPSELYEKRRKLKISRKKMARLIGVNSSSVRGWEKGENGISPVHLPKVAEHYKIPLEELESFCRDFKTQGQRLAILRRKLKSLEYDDSTPVLEEYETSLIGDAMEEATGSREVMIPIHTLRHREGMPKRCERIRMKKVKF